MASVMSTAGFRAPNRTADALDTILKGLAIAEKGYGLVTAPEDRAFLRKQKELEGERAQAGLDLAREKQTTEQFKFGAQQQQKADEKKIKTFKTVTDLRKEYNKEISKAREATVAHTKLSNASKGGTQADDLAMVFNFMKVLDPGSTVRESEAAEVENTKGVPESIRSLYNRTLSGQRLNPEQRQNLVAASQRALNAYAKDTRDLNEQFEGLAKQLNVPFSDIARGLKDKVEGPKSPGTALRKPSGDRLPVEVPKNQIREVGSAVKDVLGEIVEDVTAVITGEEETVTIEWQGRRKKVPVSRAESWLKQLPGSKLIEPGK